MVCWLCAIDILFVRVNLNLYVMLISKKRAKQGHMNVFNILIKICQGFADFRIMPDGSYLSGVNNNNSLKGRSFLLGMLLLQF